MQQLTTFRGAPGDPTGGPPGTAPETVDVAAAVGGRPTTRVGAWLLRRHGPLAELAIVLIGYVVYDASRGLAGVGRAAPLAHARDIYSWERASGLTIEARVQDWAEGVPHLMRIFDTGYTTLHLIVTGAVLILVWWRAAPLFARLRTAFLLTSGMALIGFVAFPAAPPRMASLGIVDTVSSGSVNLESGALQHFYNPYAAFPSLHLAYATLAGIGIFLVARNRALRVLGVAYPAFVAVEVVATGNHFVLDVVAGVAVAAVGWAVASIMDRRVATAATAAGAALAAHPAGSARRGAATRVEPPAISRSSRSGCTRTGRPAPGTSPHSAGRPRS